jgi:two-component system cell cycle response regulator DivK
MVERSEMPDLLKSWEDGMGKTVLIVEDNELNMKLFRDLLEAHGYQTSGTSNGFEALNLVRKMRPDLILMDIQLPQVSGLEVTRWIKDDPELRGIPVVAVTAFAMKATKSASVKAAAKPIFPNRSRSANS